MPESSSLPYMKLSERIETAGFFATLPERAGLQSTASISFYFLFLFYDFHLSSVSLHLFLLIMRSPPLKTLTSESQIRSPTLLNQQLPNPITQITNMPISTLRTQLIQRLFQSQQIFHISSTRSNTIKNMLRQLLRILWTDKLWVIRRADVDCASDVCGAVGGAEVCVVDAVAVDFTDVEVLLDFLGFFRFDAVGCAPDFVALDWVGIV